MSNLDFGKFDFLETNSIMEIFPEETISLLVKSLDLGKVKMGEIHFCQPFFPCPFPLKLHFGALDAIFLNKCLRFCTLVQDE